MLSILREFVIREDSQEAPRRLANGHSSPRRMPAGHRSQSGSDWAYAKRALARGDAPGGRHLTHSRLPCGRQSRSEHYAALTVSKAQKAVVNPERVTTTGLEPLTLVDRKTQERG